jgi:tetratricopeptide (TPR) repeat protein
MAKRKVVQTASSISNDETLVDISQVGNRWTALWDKYGKIITAVGIGLLAVVLLYTAYKFYINSKQEEAVKEIYQAEAMFERDSFELALNGVSGSIGYIEFISKYGSTPAGNTAKYAAGICYLNLGQFDNAIKMLEDYSCKGDVAPIMKHSALGDAYSELGQMDKAMKNYEEAAYVGGDNAAQGMARKKLGLFKEKQGDKQGALKVYQSIKNDFPKSVESSDIDKYIIRVGGELK